MQKLDIHRQFGHSNLTISSLLKFTAGYMIVFPVGMGALWILVSVCGLHYMLGAVISGGISLVMRYLISAVIAFDRKVL